uniref:Phosphoribosyltransferase n=1 Tax=Eiseniibacteriota bacterium TaxID=2212470 RepID=A0A832MJ22_UNCEI
MIFRDREHAATLLAARLDAWRGRRPLVLAIPRGAVPMGRTLARALEGDLDVVLVHKVGAPYQPEFAIGAVDESGAWHAEAHARSMGIDPGWLAAECARQVARLRERRAAWSPGRAALDPAGRVAIVVDDGIATGATMDAAVRLLRARGPERIIVAAAVASPEAVTRLRRAADEVVALHVPRDFRAVSLWFEDFAQVEDDEVAAILAAERERERARPAGDGPPADVRRP